MVKMATKLVKPNFKIAQMKKNQTIVDYILDDLKGVDMKPLKLDPDFIRYIAELIENDCKKGKNEHEKVDKMSIFELVIKKIYADIKPEEIAMCKSVCEFLLKNKLVKKTSLTKIMCFFCSKSYVRLSNKHVVQFSGIGIQPIEIEKSSVVTHSIKIR